MRWPPPRTPPVPRRPCWCRSISATSRRKRGVPTEQADAFIAAMRARFGVALQGLMCIPPAGRDPAPFFIRLVQLADAHGLAVRSMGMSGDFELAIAHGATQIRIGAALFGARSAAPGGPS